MFIFPPKTPCLRNPGNSATLKCASGRPRTRPLQPLLHLPLAPLQVSRCVSCVSTRPTSPAPAVTPWTSRRRLRTGRGDGNAKRADNHANVTLKVTTAAMVPGAREALSSGTSGARLQPVVAPLMGATGTLAKSRTSHRYRQSKNWLIEKKVVRVYIYMYIYTWIYI